MTNAGPGALHSLLGSRWCPGPISDARLKSRRAVHTIMSRRVAMRKGPGGSASRETVEADFPADVRLKRRPLNPCL